MKANGNNRPWNKGKTVGQKAPFPPDAIFVTRHVLKDEPRDLTLFNTAIDTMLRATDLLALRVEDVTDHNGDVLEEGQTRQNKTRVGAQFVLKDKARASLAARIAASGKFPGDYLFTSCARIRSARHACLCHRELLEIKSSSVHESGLTPN